MKMTALVGGIIGSSIGAAVWFWLETGTPPRDASWAPILIGILAGVGTRVLAHPIPLPLVRGALTALVALLAMVGTRQFITYRVQQEAIAMAEKNPAIVVDVLSDAETESDIAMDEEVMDEERMDEEDTLADAADEPADAAGEESEIAEGLDVTVFPPEESIPKTMVPKPGLGERPLMVGFSYAVGILLAYFLGKGPALDAAARETAATNPSA